VSSVSSSESNLDSSSVDDSYLQFLNLSAIPLDTSTDYSDDG
jgi:hypothetical protein